MRGRSFQSPSTQLPNPYPHQVHALLARISPTTPSFVYKYITLRPATTGKRPNISRSASLPIHFFPAHHTRRGTRKRASARGMASVLAFTRCSLLLLLLLATVSQALNVGDLLGTAPSFPQGSQGCSRTCESSFCIVPPLLRYGKYCGILYSGCPGEKPCDALDACCMVHDHCVATHDNDYLNTRCNENLLSCLDRVSPAGPTFPGNGCGVGQTASVIRGVIESAVLAGKILHKRDDGQ